MDDNETYEYAWGKKGERVYDFRKAGKTKRNSMIAALSLNFLIAPMIFEGCCSREVFETYLEKVLAKNHNLQGKIIVLDNASIHKYGRIREIVEKAGAQLLYLPTYSPDLNPIEHQWARIKNLVRKIISSTQCCLTIALERAFENVLCLSY